MEFRNWNLKNKTMNEKFYNKLKSVFTDDLNYIERNYKNNNKNFKVDVIDKMTDYTIRDLIDNDLKIKYFLSAFLT